MKTTEMTRDIYTTHLSVAWFPNRGGTEPQLVGSGHTT